MLKAALSEQMICQMPLAQLFAQCQRETIHFMRRQPHDTRFGYELFCRAAAGDEAAWVYVYEQYAPLVAHWIGRHPAFIYSDEEIQYLVNRTFERLWRQLAAGKMADFAELKQILRYLELCAVSCLLDFNRQKKGQTETSLETLSYAHPALTIESDPDKWVDEQKVELWRLLWQLVTDEAERMVLIASYIFNLKPDQIQENYHHLFETVKDVYRIKQNLKQRLRRAPQLRQFEM
ncbi:MAG: hypothetical protein KJ063_04930 [Anaerolineae bacterium]|nr:hypothetical protein [Anaerolineae bacterium]